MALLSLKEYYHAKYPDAKAELSGQTNEGIIHVICDYDNWRNINLTNLLNARVFNVDESLNMFFRGSRKKAEDEATYFAAEVHNYVPELSFGENLNLGLSKVIPLKEQCAQADRIAKDSLNWELPDFGHYPSQAGSGMPDAVLCQKLEILRALTVPCKTIFFGNTFSALTTADINRIGVLLRQKAADRKCLVILSQEPEKFTKIATKTDIYRNGKRYTDLQSAKNAAADDNKDIFPEFNNKPTGNILEVLGLQLEGFSKEISFTLRKGEILGITGLTGSGKSELLKALFGLEKCSRGIITINGKHLKARENTTTNALKRGISYFGSEPFCFEALSAVTAAALPTPDKFATLGIFKVDVAKSNFIDCHKKLKEITGASDELVADNDLRAMLVMTADNPVVIFDAPTKNISAEKCRDIYKLIAVLAAEGKGIVLTAANKEELINICDTIAVIHNGELCPPRPAGKWTTEEIELYENSGKLGAVSIL